MTTPRKVDLSEFYELGHPNSKGCWFASRLNDEQREKVTSAHSAGFSYRLISTVLSKWDIDVKSTTIGGHFTGQCSCEQ
jgi:hypothetical protein